MSSLTTNLKLVKPELQDNITPTIFADNFDKIDTALEGVSLEEIEASTNLDGKIPSAAALKEVNNSIGKDMNGMTLHEKLDRILGKGFSLTEVGVIEGDGSLSATSIDGYKDLSASNFIACPIKVYSFSGSGSSGNATSNLEPTLSYDNSTGLITMTNCIYTKKHPTNSSVTTFISKLTNKIYLVY